MVWEGSAPAGSRGKLTPGGVPSQGKITKNVEREILNHSLLIHPHVVRFYECFLTPKHLAIAMEYAAGGTMYNLVTAPGK